MEMSELLTQLNSETEQYEYEMLPYMSSKGNAAWAVASPDGYIGINAALGGEGKEKELDACGGAYWGCSPRRKGRTPGSAIQKR